MDAHARLLAVEVLLADPQSLGNDALVSCVRSSEGYFC